MSERKEPQRGYRRQSLIFNTSMQKKLAAIIAIVVLALIALCIRIAYIDIAKGNEYSIKVLSQQGFTSRTIPYKRGDIQDRNGNVMATSVMVYNLVIDSKVIMSDEKYFRPTVNALVKYLNFDEDELKKGIRDRKDNSYWVVAKNLEYEEIEKLEKYMKGDYIKDDDDEEAVQNTKGIWFEKKYKRMYPNNTLACSTIGFANSNNVAEVGMENSFAKYLQGVDGREYGYMDSDNNMEGVIKDAEDGSTVVSTIDTNIQRIVQKAVRKYMKKYKPTRIAVVIADPNNGDILAMSDDKVFDLNDPYNLEEYYSQAKIDAMSQKEQSEKMNEIWSNYCVSDSYEPGSTFKPFTIAAAMEEGRVNKHSTFSCDGSQSVGGFNIKCHLVSGHGQLNLKNALAQSCNDSLMQIGFKLGPKKMAEYQARFGFGTKTGIELPNETRGLVYDGKMDMATLATNSFGQNLTVNMIQMVQGFSSIVNGGNYYEPHIAKQIINKDGDLEKSYAKTLVKQTCTRNTTTFLRQALREVVLTGTGTTAAIDGYTVAGKTGTAEKVNTSKNAKGRLAGQYILSFLGMVPCENPKVVCYTLMDSPKDNTQATAYNTELWTYIMKQVLPYMGIEKTEKLEEKAKKKSLTKEFYSNGIIQGDDGSLVLKDKTLNE
ncbi:MAG: peptidoglycan glycosyltransferase [Eubacterium sp.]|nr:peptidoglycan glycosyltransferase [Eubacterium sp.]